MNVNSNDNSKMEIPCPCKSGKSYLDCCEPIHAKISNAKTAADLMRARYSAYVIENIDFLKKSAVKEIQDQFDEEATKNWCRCSQWHGLEIISTEKGEKDDKTGVVEFRALYTANNELCNHHEIATFVKEKDGWKFEDGELVSEKPIVREEPKIGRNDPCPCGSGKKYKKCCGK